jgi:hypothetical protein
MGRYAAALGVVHYWIKDREAASVLRLERIGWS